MCPYQTNLAVSPVAPQSSGCPSPSSSCAQTRCVGSWLHLKSYDGSRPKGGWASAEFLFDTKCGTNFGESSSPIRWFKLALEAIAPISIVYKLLFLLSKTAKNICKVKTSSSCWLQLWQVGCFPLQHLSQAS